MPSSYKGDKGSLEKLLLLGLGYEMYKMNLVLNISQCKKSLQTTTMMESHAREIKRVRMISWMDSY